MPPAKVSGKDLQTISIFSGRIAFLFFIVEQSPEKADQSDEEQQIPGHTFSEHDCLILM
jgi:hypothetical protein